MKNSYKSSYSCTDFASLYAKVLDELGRIGIFDADDYVRCREIRYYFNRREDLMKLEWSFANNCKSLLENSQHIMWDPLGLSILVRERMPSLTAHQVKKALFLAQSTTLIARPITVQDFDASGDDNPDSIDFCYGPDIEGPLRLLYEHHQDIKSGAFIPLPETIELVDGDVFDEIYHWGIRPNGMTDDDLFYEAFNQARSYTQLPSNVFRLSIHGQALGNNLDLIKLGIVLPSFDRIPIATVRKIRKDYYDEFRRFQRELVILSEQFSNASDESRMQSVLIRISDEVHKLNKTVNSLKRIHKSMAAVTSLITIVFYIAIKNPALMTHLQEILSGLASGVGTAAFVEYFHSVKDAKKEMDASPFYFPIRMKEDISSKEKRLGL